MIVKLIFDDEECELALKDDVIEKITYLMILNEAEKGLIHIGDRKRLLKAIMFCKLRPWVNKRTFMAIKEAEDLFIYIDHVLRLKRGPEIVSN